MAIIATSRTAGFSGATNVSGYGNWSSFMNSYAISFTTSTAGLQSRKDTASVNVNFPADGTYTVTCAADNAAYSSMTVDGNNCNVGALSSEGSTTDITVTAGTKSVSITIGNEDTKVSLDGFGDNPMGLAFTIAEKSISGAPESVSVGAGPKPAVTPWSELLPTCAAKPTTQTSSGGLIISENGSSGIKLNLKNYANKLVTLKVVRQGTGAWQNGFGFSAPNASDILVNGSEQTGSVYNRKGYTNPDVGNTTHIIYLCNLDGGDYDYTFSHSSVTGPRPTRINYRLDSKTSSEDVKETIDGVEVTKTVTTTTYFWAPYPEEYPGAWPPCYVGVGIKRTGGNEVSWCYEDGGGEPFCDQTVTVTVVDTREAIGLVGNICFSDLINQVWIDDPLVDRTNTAKIWSDGITSSELLISGTEGLMFDGLTNTRVVTAEGGVAGFIDWNKDNAVNLVGLTGPVKLQMVYKDTHTFTVNDSPAFIAPADLEDGDIALVEIAASGNTVNSFRVEAADNQTPVEIYAVTQGESDTIVVDDTDFIVEGRSFVDYRDHSTKIRFRKPASKSSKTTFQDPLCFTDFRGIAGAKTPSELGII